MTISVEDLRHRFTEFQIDGCVDIGAFHELVRSCHLGEATLNDGLITTLFKLLDVSRRGVINWAEFERLPSLLMSIALKPSHPGDPLPPSGTVEIPPVAVPMSSSVRPVKLTLPAVEEGQLDKGSTWAKLGLDIEDDIHLASSKHGGYTQTKAITMTIYSSQFDWSQSEEVPAEITQERRAFR
ncbi:hypothetical protein FOL46_009421 [Perkinsus olseni]|uniref:Uncharacterized protein n=1 Tax=Perkinsus olseni TaxID=32597 RepID=A0A7J6L0J3_PEROL|nr:hypothetical protein FOL46_009421 [Perkinsus olseni]